MEYRSQYDRVRIRTEKGSPIRTIYAGKLDKKGRLEVVPKGKEDYYSYIQSFADSVDINVLLKQFKNGDKEALNQRIGKFIDTTDMPTDIHGMLEYCQNCNEFFESLPSEFKSKFNNNINEFMLEFNTDKFNEKLQVYNNSKVNNIEEKKEEIKENE